MLETGIDLEQLRVFVAVADTGSILRASEALRTSRSRIRRHLESLEASVGSTLTRRVRDGIELTPLGEELLPRARSVLGAGRAFVQHARERTREPSRLFRLGIQVGYPHALALLVEDLVTEVEGRVRLEHVISERPSELMPDKADAVLCLGSQRPRVPCEIVELGTLPVQLLAAPGFVDEHGPFETLDAAVARLAGAWRPPSGPFDGLHHVEGHLVSIDPPLVTPDEAFLYTVARAGRGLVYAPRGAGSEDLAVVLGDIVGHREPLSMMVAPELAETNRMASFVAVARQILRAFA